MNVSKQSRKSSRSPSGKRIPMMRMRRTMLMTGAMVRASQPCQSSLARFESFLSQHVILVDFPNSAQREPSPEPPKASQAKKPPPPVKPKPVVAAKATPVQAPSPVPTASAYGVSDPAISIHEVIIHCRSASDSDAPATLAIDEDLVIPPSLTGQFPKPKNTNKRLPTRCDMS